MEGLSAILTQTTGTSVVPATETELQKLLIDERMRCEHHKTNYQTLKEEYNSFKVQYENSQKEHKRAFADKERILEKLQLQFAELHAKFLDQTREVKELEDQVLSPQKMKRLKTQIKQELEAQMKERIQKMDNEIEKYRGDYHKLRYEYTILKSQCAHQQELQTHVIEEQRIKYEAEISELEKDKAELQNQIMCVDPTRDSKRVEELQKDKSQLLQKLKGLETEVKDLRAEKDNCGAQVENVQRIQVRQMAEAQTTIRSLESEKQNVKLQVERLDKELHEAREQNDILTGKLHKTEREVNDLNSRINELKYSSKIEIDNIKLEAARGKNEEERVRDKIQSQLDALETENRILKATLDRLKEILSEKERELIRRVQAAKEAGFQEIAKLQDERLEFEKQIAELEKFKAEHDNQKLDEMSQLEEKIHIAQVAEESSKRELQSLRSKVQQQMVYMEQLEKGKRDEADLKQEINDLRIKLTSLSESQNNLLSANEKLQKKVEWLKQENRNTRNQTEKEHFILLNTVLELEGYRIEWLQEKHKLQDNKSLLEEKYSKLKAKLNRAAVAQKKRKTITENRCRNHVERIEILEAVKEELETQIQILNRQNVPREEFGRLQKRFKDLQRRHNEFRNLILGPSIPASGLLNPTIFLSSRIIPGADFSIHNVQEQQHQSEFSLLRKRLEELEITQKKQMEELGPPIEFTRPESNDSGPLQGNIGDEISEISDSSLHPKLE
ncbi:LOW QUALITY PROTEIN: centrosomal protein of 83 kDa [Pelodytes ibericus]